MKHRALHAVMATAWAMTPEYCELIADIAARESEFSGNLEALEAKLGRPLGNTERTTTRDGVAILPVQGPLFAKANLMTEFSGATSYDILARDFAVARDDPNVQAIVIKGSSPGGAVEGASEYAQMVYQARGTKPIIAFIEGDCCSAFYWIASACDQIVMADTAMAGCLGVQMGLTARDPRPGERAIRFVSSNSKNKNADPETEAGAAQIQSIVDGLETVFLSAVAQFRGTTLENVIQSYGQGSVFVAAEAVRRGMADRIGTFEGLIESLKLEMSSMDYKALTAQALAENRPDLVQAFKAEGMASVEKIDAEAVRADAIKAERERITAIEALAVPGTDALIAQFKSDGTSPSDAALKIVQAVKAGQASAGAAHLAGVKATEATLIPPKTLEETDNTAADPVEAMLSLGRASGAIR